jgi:hypothetical protein
VRKLNEAQWTDILRRKDLGESVRSIAKDYEVATSHIYNTAKKRKKSAAKATRKPAPKSVDIQLQPASDGIVTIIRTDVHTARALLMGESWK